MRRSVPENHPLQRLFRAALEKAFFEHQNLYEPEVADHLADSVLCDFIHVDRVYRLKDSAGKTLQDLPEILQVSVEPEGPERRLEVDRYIGDFTLFMVGFFPGFVTKERWFAPQPMVTKVGPILVSFRRPVDYYAAEGRNAYGRAAETARLFDRTSQGVFRRLANGFDGYLGVIESVRDILSEVPQVRELEGELEAG